MAQRHPGRPAVAAARGTQAAAAAAVGLRLAALTGVAATADGAPSEFRHGLLLLTALAAAALVAGVVLDSGQVVARLLSTRLLVGIGRISYGLYLWHWPVYLALDGERTGLHGYLLAALRVAVTGALAGASMVLIERPAQRVRVRARRVLPAAAAGVAAVLVVAACHRARPGAPGRGGTAVGERAPCSPSGAGQAGATVARSLAADGRQA